MWDLDALQYSLREGPCYDSIRGNSVTVVDNARHDQRWPTYMPHAVQMGLRAQLAVGLYAHDDSLGGINLYSTSRHWVDEEAVSIAELFATQAAIALGRSREAVQFSTALESRKMIGQAIGIVMALRDERGPGVPVPHQDLVDQQPQAPRRRCRARPTDEQPQRGRRPST